MTETMLLIPGRTSKQGTSLNAGKLGAEYIEVTSTVEINSDDMARLGLKEGDALRLSAAELGWEAVSNVRQANERQQLLHALGHLCLAGAAIFLVVALLLRAIDPAMLKPGRDRLAARS